MSETMPSPEPELPHRPSLKARIKASLLGGMAAALVAPAIWFLLVLLRPSGFWTHPLDVLFAAPAIWLFASLIAVPAGILLGPALLALTFRSPRPQLSACVLGALSGGAIVYVLPVLAGSANGAFYPEQALVGAAIGAVGAWAAARFLSQSRSRRRVENAA